MYLLRAGTAAQIWQRREPQGTIDRRRALDRARQLRREPVTWTSWEPASLGVEDAMKFMVIVKANEETEAGAMPDQKLLEEMGRFNEELVKAGVLLAGEGLHPSSKGARVRFSGTSRSVINGPFPEVKELVAGFWIWQVRSKEEAIEWVKRCPNPTRGESVIEIRQILERDDFGAALTPELREAEARMRAGK